MVEEKEKSDDLIRFSSGPITPYDVAYDMSKEHPLVEIDGREVEFDEEEQQYVFADENGGESR